MQAGATFPAIPSVPGHRLVKAAIAAVVVVAALQELTYARSRMTRATNNWWTGVMHREDARIDADAIAYLLRRLAPH